MLGLSMIAPALVRADEPTFIPVEDDLEGFEDLTAEQQAGLAIIANLLCLDYAVKVSPQYTAETIGNWLEDEILEPVLSRTGLAGSYYTNKQVNQIYENIQNYHFHTSSGHRFAVDFDEGTVLALVGNHFQNYNDLQLSVEADEFPSYVPVEYRNALSEINTVNDLNLSGIIYGTDGRIFTRIDQPDFTKTIFSPGRYYYNSDRSVMRGLFYYSGMYDDMYGWYNRYEINSSGAPGWYTWSYSYDAGTPGINLYNDRYKVLIPPDTEWGEYEDSYTLIMQPWNGYNENDLRFRIDFADISERKTSGSTGVQQDLSFDYRYTNSDTQYSGHGMALSIVADATGRNACLSVTDTSDESTPQIDLYVQKQTEDKLLDTMWRLSDSFRNIDVYVGNDWSTATLWYQSVDTGTSFTPTSETVLPGDNKPTPLIHMPTYNTIDLLQLYLLLKNTVRGGDTITINNIVNNNNTYVVFPDDNGDAPSEPVVDSPPATIINNTTNVEVDESSKDKDFSIDENSIPGSLDFSGLGKLWSLDLAYDEGSVVPTRTRLMAAAAVSTRGTSGGTAIGQGSGRVASATTAAKTIVQLASDFLGDAAQYVWYLVGLCCIASLIIKLLHS